MSPLSAHIGLRQRPLTTAHLAQTMTLIGLSAVELEETLAAELASNPALELVSEIRCPTCGRRLKRMPCPVCHMAPRANDGPIVYLSARGTTTGTMCGEGTDGEEREAVEPRAPEKLAEHILRQIAPALDVDDRPIAAYLLARLDERGFLPESRAECAQFLRVTLQRVQCVLNLVQHAEPPGLGARDTRQSLLLQLESLEEEGKSHPLARACIANHWDMLCRHDFGRVARILGVSREEVKDARDFIQRNLTPYPAQAFWGDGRGRPCADNSAYFRPDVIISRPPHDANGPLHVEVFTPIAGTLRVDPAIKNALAECEEGERESWERYVERAVLFAKCMQQRNNTMCRLLEAIACEQRQFIHGGDRDLKPLTRVSLAVRLGVHESTISRAVANKTAALPDGRIVPLSKFFDRSLSVRDAVKSIVAAEPRPLTDDEIAACLARQGYHVARRTVAKYRAAEGILPAAARRRQASYSNGQRR
ncbi:MAG: hypothetical protein HY023_09435 [Chloroflexi bacterium]|nr:hypothetical protein [Chloroflexota bacterium]